MTEKIVLSKRIYELVAGDVFWFSGNWRKVSKIDRDENLLYYKRLHEEQAGNAETMMAKSQMLVALKL